MTELIPGYKPDLDFKAEADKMMLVGQMLTGLALDAIAATVEAAHTIGPFLDPTKYRDALHGGSMDFVAELANALKPARDLVVARLEGEGLR